MKKVLLFLISMLMVVFMAACGGGEGEEAASDGGDTGGSSTVDIEASNWEFDKSEYTAAAGNVTLNLKNAEGHHGITVEGTDLKIEGEGEATANLEAGEYTIICNIPCGEGHAEMTATLVVE
jgi:cytochrome c oxidase subunit 2